MTGQLPLDIPGTESWAAISDDQRYRYELGRRWDDGPLLEWVMLNPSVADATDDDPTIRRCIRFAKDWGFNGIRVTNLFAYRATDPDTLLNPDIDPFGPQNNDYLSTERGPITVCGWGAHKMIAAALLVHCGDPLLKRSALMCLGYNKDGSPKHPLYVPKNAGAQPWPKPDPRERHY